MIRTAPAALAAVSLLLVGSPAHAADKPTPPPVFSCTLTDTCPPPCEWGDGCNEPAVNTIPAADGVIEAAGRRALGFKVYWGDRTALLPRLGHMLYQCNVSNGRGTDQAQACRDGWRDYYSALVAVRDAAASPNLSPWPVAP